MAVHPDNAGPFFYVLREAVRILFVDDDPILREFAVVNLASEHAVVDTAQDGVAALAAIEANTPDLVLLDLEMPTLDGFGVLQALQSGCALARSAGDRGHRPRGRRRGRPRVRRRAPPRSWSSR